MRKYVITKYAKINYPDGIGASLEDSVFGSYAASTAGVTNTFYTRIEDAKKDLVRLQEVNPSVGYGIVQIRGE